MRRVGVISALALVACEREAPLPAPPPPAPSAPAPGPVVELDASPAEGVSAPRAPADPHRLRAAEGTFVVAEPAAVRTGEHATATLTVTAAPGYHVNLEFPLRLSLVPPPGITLDGGDRLTAADARELDDRHLVLPVALTATEPGRYAVTGRFKFAVCQRDACFAKDEPVAIHLAASGP